MLFLIMCCCGNILQRATVGELVYTVGGLAQLTLAPDFFFFTILFSLFTFLLCYLIEDKSFALCTCQGNHALLLQCAFTRKTTQTHKTLRVNEHSEATD